VGWLLDSAGFASFPMEAVARAAGVSSMTVCTQFTSKAGLPEAVFGWVASTAVCAGRLRQPASGAIMRSAGLGWPPLLDRHGRVIDDTRWVPPSHGHAR
jgi:AcrR family transcriptional regulator